MLQAILFDLDGTLLDRDRSIATFIHGQFERFQTRMAHVQQNSYVRRFIELDQRGYVWKDKVYQELAREFFLQEISAEELLTDYMEQFRYSCTPFSGMHEMLNRLRAKGIPLGLITNGRGPFQMASIQALGIEPYFDCVLISEWEGVAKPDPRIFLRACERLGVSAAECVFVGDHPVNDVAAAKAVGMRAVWKRDRFFSPRRKRMRSLTSCSNWRRCWQNRRNTITVPILPYSSLDISPSTCYNS